MEHKCELKETISILSSLLYLKGELNKAGFNATENLITYASGVFIEEVKLQNKSNADMQTVIYILNGIANKSPIQIRQLLESLENFDASNDDEIIRNIN